MLRMVTGPFPAYLVLLLFHCIATVTVRVEADPEVNDINTILFADQTIGRAALLTIHNFLLCTIT